MYNMLFGRNILAECLLITINMTPGDFPRYRDTWLDEDKDEEENGKENKEYNLVVLTRTGGGNRDEYEEDNEALTFNEHYLYDNDADFDSTYAEFYFRIPNIFNEDIKKIKNNDLNNLSVEFMNKLKEDMPDHYNKLVDHINKKNTNPT